MKSDKVKKKKRPVDEEFVIGRMPTSDSSSPKKKKKRPVTEDEAPIKKKKKRSPDVASAKVERRKKRLNEALADLDLEALTKNARPGEREYIDEFVWMFNRIGRLIRATEKRALKSGQSKDIYALSTLISQQREIIADIRTLADLSGQILMVKDMVLQPFVGAVGQNLLDGYYQMRTLVTNTSKPDQTQFALKQLDKIVQEQGKFLQIQYHNGIGQIERVFSGEEIVPEGEAPKKKKGKKKKKG